MQEIQNLVTVISETQSYFRHQAQKQVNIGLTLRNWFFGFYIVEYEQKGKDRAVYGENLYKEIANRCKHINGMSKSNLLSTKPFIKCTQTFSSQILENYILMIFSEVKFCRK